MMFFSESCSPACKLGENGAASKLVSAEVATSHRQCLLLEWS